MFALEFNVPTDTLWGELGAENVAPESATFIFIGLRSVNERMLFFFLSPPPG